MRVILFADSFVCCGSIRIREFIKVIKVFRLKNIFIKNFVFRRYWSICSHFFWNLKNGVYLISAQFTQVTTYVINIQVGFTGYLLFFCFKYNKDWLRIHFYTNVNNYKWFLVNRCYYVSNLHNLQRVVIEITS